jgi:hypothetical protein
MKVRSGNPELRFDVPVTPYMTTGAPARYRGADAYNAGHAAGVQARIKHGTDKVREFLIHYNIRDDYDRGFRDGLENK